VYVNNFVHDVVITDITPSSTLANQGETIDVNVTVANHGSYAETLNVTLYANASTIESHILPLNQGSFATISFMWNTTGFVNGNYTLNAKISPVTDEIDTTNNDLELTEQQIIIVPEFPSILILFVLMLITAIIAVICKRKCLESQN
jgi:hypothetical protein